MATKVKVTQQPVEELEQKYGVKAKDGTLDYAEGKYFLVVGRKRTELDPRHLVAPEPIVRLFETKATVKVIAAKDGIMVIVWNGNRATGNKNVDAEHRRVQLSSAANVRFKKGIGTAALRSFLRSCSSRPALLNDTRRGGGCF